MAGNGGSNASGGIVIIAIGLFVLYIAISGKFPCFSSLLSCALGQSTAPTTGGPSGSVNFGPGGLQFGGSTGGLGGSILFGGGDSNPFGGSGFGNPFNGFFDDVQPGQSGIFAQGGGLVRRGNSNPNR